MSDLITMEELLAEYERLNVHQESDEGFTTRELCEHWACSKGKVMSLLQAASKAGVLFTGRRSATRIDGQPMRVPVYRIAKPIKQAKKTTKKKTKKRSR